MSLITLREKHLRHSHVLCSGARSAVPDDMFMSHSVAVGKLSWFQADFCACNGFGSGAVIVRLSPDCVRSSTVGHHVFIFGPVRAPPERHTFVWHSLPRPRTGSGPQVRLWSIERVKKISSSKSWQFFLLKRAISMLCRGAFFDTAQATWWSS